MKKRLYLIISSIILMVFVLAPCVVSAADEVMVSPSDGDLKTLVANNAGKTIILEKGTWNADETIAIPGNTTLNLNGQTVNSKVEYAFRLKNNNSSIENGTINRGGISVQGDDSGGHLGNLIIKDATANGIYVYRGKIGNISNNTISLSTKAGSKSMGIRVFSKASSGNISGNTITNCPCDGIQVGGAAGSSNDGSTAKDIINNTIKSCKGDGISVWHGSSVGKINNNKLSNIGGSATQVEDGNFGIIVNSGCKYDTCASEISGNQLDGVTHAGIVVFAKNKKTGDAAQRNKAYIKGSISNNVINNTGLVNKNVNWKNAPKNKVCRASIYVDSYAVVKGNIVGNTISNSYDDGITVLGNSEVIGSICDNKINTVTDAGIALKSGSTVKGKIYNNEINSAKIYGILVNNKSNAVGNIEKNTINKIGKNGIAVIQNSNAGTIINNTIKEGGEYGVIAGQGSTINKLKNNKIHINKAKGGSAIISNKKACIKNISKNTITGKFGCGIRVTTPTAKIKILNNTIKSSTPSNMLCQVINVDGCKKKTITIKNNKITGNGRGAGIRIKTSKNKVKGNKIKKCKPKQNIEKY